MSDKKKTVLVIDDEADVRDYLTCLLEDHGYTVETAENGEEGLHRMTERRPDAITLDITMPLKTGIRLYREIKKSVVLKDIPVIIVTGITSDFEKFISTRRTVPPPDGYVHKPVDQQKLLCLVERLTA
jgi:CheY-like chemotaxis protein